MKYIYSITAFLASSLPAFATRTAEQERIYREGLEELSRLSRPVVPPTVLEDICNELLLIQNYLTTATYTISAMALAVIAIKAFAKGKFEGAHLIAVFGGLFLLSSVPLLMMFLVRRQIKWDIRAV